LFGHVNQVDFKKQAVKVKFNTKEEEAKVHDPFIGRRHLEAAMDGKKGDKRRQFFPDYDIERIIKAPKGTVSRMTSSFLVSYKSPEDNEKKIVDIGLNIKNFTKKVHVPRYVRYVTSYEDLVINQFEDRGFNHGKFGGRNTRPHWEYSAECLDIIKEYHEKFPEAWEAQKKCMLKNRAVHPLKEIIPFEGKNEDPDAIKFIKGILQWLDSQPVSKLPFVDMGFDTIDQDLVSSLQAHRQEVQNEYDNVQLGCKNIEFLRHFHCFSESFPHWCAPFNDRQVSDFKVGHRVINICSVRRAYVPFGLRGTVVGKTNDKVIVMFDEQYLGGSDLNGFCEEYRGALVDPMYLCDVTIKF